MYYDIYHMKNGTQIKASRPEQDGSFYLYALRYTQSKERHFWDAEDEDGTDLKILTLCFRNDELEFLNMEGYVNSEEILIYHFIRRRIYTFAEAVYALDKIDRITKRLGDRFLATPEQYLFKLIVSSIRSADAELYGDALLQKSLAYAENIYRYPYVSDIYYSFLELFPDRMDSFHSCISRVYYTMRYYIRDIVQHTNGGFPVYDTSRAFIPKNSKGEELWQGS